MTYNWSSNGHRNLIRWRTLTNYLHLAVGRKRAVRKSELNFHSPENKRKGKRKRKKERKRKVGSFHFLDLYYQIEEEVFEGGSRLLFS